MGAGRISRFTIDLETKKLKLDSEVVIFQYDAQIWSCCHRGGGMAFDSEGNLYVTTGDSNSSQSTGGYSGKTASFIGFAPADDPQIVVAVTLQRPIKGYFGGAVAGPVFHDVMTYALQELKIPPTGTKSPVAVIRPKETPSPSDPTVIRDRGSSRPGR